MAFDIFSQPQGPRIDISLFGDAAQAGAKLGTEIPSTTSAIISGGIEGIQTGQKIEAQSIANKNNEAVAEINQLKAQEAEQTQALQLDATKAELQDNVTKLTQDNNLRQATQKFVDTFQKATPAEQKQLVLSGQNQGVFMQNPKLYQQALEQLSFNPTITPAEKGQINQLLKVNRTSDYWQQQAAINQDKLAASKEALYGESYITEAAKKLGITPEQVPDAVELVPHGKYQSLNGSLIPDMRSGGWATNPEFAAEGAKNSWDVVDQKTGTLLDDTGSVTDNGKKVLTDFRPQKAIADGTYARANISQITNGSSQPRQAASSDNPGIGTVNTPTRAPQAAAQQDNSFKGVVARSLRIPETQLSQLEAPLNDLETEVKNYIKEPSLRGTPTALKSFNDTVTTLSRGITDAQFKNNAGLQAQYTQSHVDAYNEALKYSMLYSQFGPKGGISLDKISRGGVLSISPELVDAFAVTSPEDLYFVKQRSAIEGNIMALVDSYALQAQNKEIRAGLAQKGSQKTISFLAGVAQRGR